MKLSWGWRIAIVYTFFAVSTVGFVAFAMTENVELVRPDYYEQSLKHDQTFASEQRGAAVGNAVSMQVNEGAVQITLPPTHTVIDSGVVSFYRPDNSLLDHSFVMHATSVVIPLARIVDGNYEVAIEWTLNGDRFRVTRQLAVGGAR